MKKEIYIISLLLIHNVQGWPSLRSNKVGTGNINIQTQPIEVATINPDSTDYIDQLIINYAPDVYLTKDEKYFPLTIENYLKNPKTVLFFLPGHKDSGSTTDKIKGFFGKGKQKDDPKVILEPGTITQEKLADRNLYKDLPGYLPEGLYFDNNGVLEKGDSPLSVYKTPEGTTFKNKKNGIIQAPYYAIYVEQGKHAYIQYYFLYGYNGTYKIAGVGPVSYSTGEHAMDLEHLTLQFDKETVHAKKPHLTRIGFLAHGSGEGKWIKAHDPKLEYNGNHIVAYAAENGHGLYPEEGIYARIFGRANDKTSKDILWKPAGIIRLRGTNDPLFNPKTMGWVAYPGDLGNEGVSSIGDKAYFNNPAYQDSGNKAIFYKKGSFVPIVIPSANPPQSLQADFTGKNPITFNPQQLPPENIKVSVNTKIIINKNNTPLIHLEKKQVPYQSLNTNEFMVDKFEGEGTLNDLGDYYELIVTTPQKAYITFTNASGTKNETEISVQ